MLLLGHGSRRSEANLVLKELMNKIRKKVENVEISYGFLQLAEPDCAAAVEELHKIGVEEIVIQPFFLNPGIHFNEDIPELIEEFSNKYPEISFTCNQVLGEDNRLADIIVDSFRRFTAIKEPQKIEDTSMDIISNLIPIQEREKEPIVKRIVHTTGDPEYAELTVISPGAIEAGLKAIKEGNRVITDVEMVRAGIRKETLKDFGSSVECFIKDKEVADFSKTNAITRAQSAVELNLDLYNGAIVAIGNAPTALFKVIDAVEEGRIKPALIIGTPVGFVGAKESKERLKELNLPYITVTGCKGGSTVAAAIVNALVILAEKAKNE